MNTFFFQKRNEHRQQKVGKKRDTRKQKKIIDSFFEQKLQLSNFRENYFWP